VKKHCHVPILFYFNLTTRSLDAIAQNCTAVRTAVQDSQRLKFEVMKDTNNLFHYADDYMVVGCFQSCVLIPPRLLSLVITYELHSVVYLN